VNKYGARKVTVDGVTFDSRGEAKRYADLRLMEKAGLIQNLTLQPTYTLVDAFTDAHGGRWRAITYRGDFQYTEAGETVVEDFKGLETPVFKLKRKLFLNRYRDVVFRVTR
jgi:hypothetical protein